MLRNFQAECSATASSVPISFPEKGTLLHSQRGDRLDRQQLTVNAL